MPALCLQVLLGEGATEKSDVWSYGVILWELCSGAWAAESGCGGLDWQGMGKRVLCSMQPTACLQRLANQPDH